MQTSPIPVYARDHTLLGICEALGEDFGVSPLLFRVPLAVCLLFNPLAVVGVYAALGAVVAISRLLAPNPRPSAAHTEQAEAEPARLQAAGNDDRDMAIAA
ncbi:MAG TPA: PspC domain-containing protein [Allosphingosinicella sp.]|nr:PspC domain-containing protein [Allosphingosinicella sp.]